MHQPPQSNLWAGNDRQEAMAQLADLCSKSLNLDVALTSGGEGFVSGKPERPQRGISALSGALGPGDIVLIEVLLARCAASLPADAVGLFDGLAELNEKVRLLAPRRKRDGIHLQAELRVAACPMTLGRASAFCEELKRLDQLARYLQENLPRSMDTARLRELYKPLQGALDYIAPWPLPESGSLKSLEQWAYETTDFLEGSASLAIAAPHQVELDLALAVLAGCALERGSSLANLVPPMVNGKALLELATKAPGPLVVPAVRLSLGSNPYELGNEMQSLLAGLASRGTPVIFTGALSQLQAVLNGGQGAVNDPLLPVVRHVPSLEIGPLVNFAVHWASELRGGLPATIQQETSEKLHAVLARHALGEQRRILPILAARAVHRCKVGGAPDDGSRGATFARSLSGLTETLGGLSTRPRSQRSLQGQELFCRVLTDPGLTERLREHLLGQDRALGELCDRLRMEALTRPLEQPLRLCAQGTPATGKSQSAVLVARELAVPYVNIDAASMPDFHTAASQLLGSGRGIVMSHMPGRLEQVAKHHTGCVVEISDLDHAAPQVRAPLADLFLQMLETGEAQSATGAMFSCANLILFFTMNLPDGADQQVRKGLGFGQCPSPREVQERVVKEIKQLLSGAFLSRVGRPILFDPLERQAMALILEKVVVDATREAAQRMGLAVSGISPTPGLGDGLLTRLQGNVVSLGARVILEQGRSLATAAFCSQLAAMSNNRAGFWQLALDKEENLVLEQCQTK